MSGLQQHLPLGALPPQPPLKGGVVGPAPPANLPQVGAPSLGTDQLSLGAGPAPAPAAPALQPMAAMAPASTEPLGGAVDQQGLIRRLLDDDQAPQAALDLARLPRQELLSVSKEMLENLRMNPSTKALVARLLTKQLPDAEALRLLGVLALKEPRVAPEAATIAITAIANTRTPQSQLVVWKFLASPGQELAATKRTFIDRLTADPQALAHPAAPVVLGAILEAHEDPDLAAAASHALSLIKNRQSRDALAGSPLFNNHDPKMRLRALWDLGKHPAPYPPKAVETLRMLTKDPDSQVADKAKELLKAK